MGVAERVRMWTSARMSFSRSLWATPKRCSSSTTTRPRSLKPIALPSTAWVPTTMSIVPSARAALTRFCSAAGTMRLTWPTCTGSPAKRSEKVLKCWRASSVVGTTTATCRPLMAAAKAARSATSVLPNPTSPQTSRSIGWPEARSPSTDSIEFSWSSVSS